SAPVDPLRPARPAGLPGEVLPRPDVVEVLGERHALRKSPGRDDASGALHRTSDSADRGQPGVNDAQRALPTGRIILTCSMAGAKLAQALMFARWRRRSESHAGE